VHPEDGVEVLATLRIDVSMGAVFYRDIYRRFGRGFTASDASHAVYDPDRLELDCHSNLALLDLRYARALGERRVMSYLVKTNFLKAVNVVEFLNLLRYDVLELELDFNQVDEMYKDEICSRLGRVVVAPGSVLNWTMVSREESYFDREIAALRLEDSEDVEDSESEDSISDYEMECET
jgi:hypothetical protein